MCASVRMCLCVCTCEDVSVCVCTHEDVSVCVCTCEDVSVCVCTCEDVSVCVHMLTLELHMGSTAETNTHPVHLYIPFPPPSSPLPPPTTHLVPVTADLPTSTACMTDIGHVGHVGLCALVAPDIASWRRGNGSRYGRQQPIRHQPFVSVHCPHRYPELV